MFLLWKPRSLAFLYARLFLVQSLAISDIVVMTNTCPILQQYITTTHPSSDASQSPLIALANADVVVSLHQHGSHDLHLASAMLMRTSHVFYGALRDERVEAKTTGFVDPGNGSRRAMKRFELEFFQNGEHLLVGKVCTGCVAAFYKYQLLTFWIGRMKSRHG